MILTLHGKGPWESIATGPSREEPREAECLPGVVLGGSDSSKAVRPVPSMSEKLKALVLAYQRIMESYQQLVEDLDARTGELEAQTRVLSRQYELEAVRLASDANEVRTALTALKGALYLLLHRPPTDPETRRTLLARAYENAERVMDSMRLHS